MLETRRGADLITAVHRAALDPTGWQGVVSQIERWTDGNPVALHGFDTAIGQSITTWIGSFDPAVVQSYLDYYCTISPWPKRFAQFPSSRALAVHQMGLSEDFWKSEFYQDWVLPQEDLSAGAAIRTRSHGTRSLIAGVNIRRRDQGKLENISCHLLHLLEPHLSHALAVNETLARLQTQSTTAQSSSDKLAKAGRLIMTLDRLLCWADAGGVALFGHLLGLTPSGRVYFIASSAQEWLERISVLLSPKDGQAAQARHLETRLLYDGRPWVIRALRCEGNIPSSPIFPGLAQNGFHRSDHTLALVIEPMIQGHTTEQILRQKFSLSVSEIEVTLAIAEGLGTAEIAAIRGVSLNTVRNQIQSVLTKTETRGRGDLIRRLGQITANRR